MALKQNSVLLRQNCFSLKTAGQASCSRAASWSGTESYNLHDTLGDYTGYPHGYGIGNSWLPPRKAGGLSSYEPEGIFFTANSLNVAQGRNIDSAGSFAFTAGSATGAAVAAATGSSSFVFTGTGTAVAPINATATGSFTFTAGATSLSAPSAILGSSAFAFTGINLPTYARGFMVATPIDTSLTAATIAEAVWSEVLEGTLTAEGIMRVILAVQAGKTDISGTTVKFRDLADTKDRITATMTGSERVSIVLDGS